MMINGKPKLACNTFLRDLPPGPVTVEPLNNFPIERDLVVSVDDFVKKIESIYPYIIPKEPKTIAEGPYLRPRRSCRLRILQRLHQLHAVLCGLPAVRRKSRIHRSRRAWRCCSATTAIPVTAARRSGSTRSMARTACGPARPSASALVPRPNCGQKLIDGSCWLSGASTGGLISLLMMRKYGLNGISRGY